MEDILSKSQEMKNGGLGVEIGLRWPPDISLLIASQWLT